MTTETTLRLDGQTAIITGAAGLIGSALSAGFAANGANVVLVDRDADGLARLVEAGIGVLADDFSLRERGIPPDGLVRGVQPAPIGTVVDRMADGWKVIWH